MFGEKTAKSVNRPAARGVISALRGFQQPIEFFRAHAVLRERAPLYAGRADRTGVQMSALFTGSIRLVAPDFDLFTALLTADVFRFG